MPIELRYGDMSYQVAPVTADTKSFTLEIDGRRVTVSRRDVQYRQFERLYEPISGRPTDVSLIAVFIPAAANQILEPRLRHEGEPNAEQLIAQDMKISVEELEKWHVLFSQI